MNKIYTIALLLTLIFPAVPSMALGGYSDCGDIDFEYTVEGNTVEFKAVSDVQVVQWHWDFGDGSIARGEQAKNVYPDPGVYTVCLEALIMSNNSNNYCKVQLCKEVKVDRNTNNNCDLEADFDFRIDGTVVRFSANSNHNATAFSWSFRPNNSTGGQQNILHDFKEPGIYEVCLIASLPGTDCRVRVCKKIEITEENECGLEADFDFRIDGTVVRFSANSNHNATVFSWSLRPNNSTGGQQNISHDFKEPGIYEVCLIASLPGTDCRVRVCKKIEITEENECGLEADFDIIQNGNTFRFIGKANVSDGQFLWSFGDGNSDEGRMIGHTYSDDGIFKVCLTVTNRDRSCRVLICKEIRTFDQNDDECNIPIDFRHTIVRNQVQFVANTISGSSNTSYEFYWNFGDGATAGGNTVRHEYRKPGMYTVCLTVVDPNVPCKKQICKRIVVGNRSDIGISRYSADNDDEFDFVFYPNPATQLIQLDANDDIAGYELWDINSILLLSSPASGQNMQVRLSDIPPGIYILRVFSLDGKAASKRINIQ